MASSLFMLSTVSNVAAGSFLESGCAANLTSFAATYWLHSTLLLSCAWLLIRASKPESHFVRERIWKFAAVASLATATIQLATGLGVVVLAERDASTEASADVITSRNREEPTHSSRSRMTHAEAQQQLAAVLQIVQDSLNDLGTGTPATLAESKTNHEPVETQKVDQASMEVTEEVPPSVMYLPASDDQPFVNQKQAPIPKAVPAFSDPAEIVVQKTATVKPEITNDR